MFQELVSLEFMTLLLEEHCDMLQQEVDDLPDELAAARKEVGLS